MCTGMLWSLASHSVASGPPSEHRVSRAMAYSEDGLTFGPGGVYGELSLPRVLFANCGL